MTCKVVYISPDNNCSCGRFDVGIKLALACQSLKMTNWPASDRGHGLQKQVHLATSLSIFEMNYLLNKTNACHASRCHYCSKFASLSKMRPIFIRTRWEFFRLQTMTKSIRCPQAVIFSVPSRSIRLWRRRSLCSLCDRR